VTNARRSDHIEFVRLGGHAVRVTSLTLDEQSGSFTLVTITRGSRDAELLTDLINQECVELEIPGQETMTVHASDIDRRDFGEGQSAITRFSVVLSPGEHVPPCPPEPLEQSLEERIAALEVEIRELRAMVNRIDKQS